MGWARSSAPCVTEPRSSSLARDACWTGRLEALAPGTRVALFALNLQTESVLLRGDFAGWRGRGPARVGVIDVDWVYNSMPPLAGQIYPPLELAPAEAAGENPARKRE